MESAKETIEIQRIALMAQERCMRKRKQPTVFIVINKEIKYKMQAVKYALKYEYFRQGGRWEDICKLVCTWANTNINLIRLVGISSVLCSFDNTTMVTLYYNEGVISKDVLQQTEHLVLAYEIISSDKNVKHSWLAHNERSKVKIAQIAQRGDIFAVNSLEHDISHKTNVTIVWYKRMK